ncbi:MAG: M14 family metallopeptidase, partial [Candidatus Eisenbacteria bacterium]
GGEPIWAFRVSNTEEGTEPRARFLVLSLVHAIEFVGVEVNIALFQRFVANMSKNPALQGREVHFLPILNPDGYLEVERGLAEGRARFRRGNRNGVDLNRNFGAFFSKRYIWHRLLRRLYRPGPRPFSEPETAALRSHLLGHRFDFALSLHSFGGRLLYPYGGKREKTHIDAWYRETARALIDHQPHYGYKAAQLSRAVPFFLVRGAEADYLHETFGTRTLVVEIARNGLRLLNPRHLFDPFPLFNPKDPQFEIENLMDAFFFFLSLNREARG